MTLIDGGFRKIFRKKRLSDVCKFFITLGISEKRVSRVANKIDTTWEKYIKEEQKFRTTAHEKHIDRLSLEDICVLTDELLLAYPDDKNIILFVKDIAGQLQQVLENEARQRIKQLHAENERNLLDPRIVGFLTAPKPIEFPVFHLIDKLSSKGLMKAEELDRFALSLISYYYDCDDYFNRGYEYFKKTFNREITVINSLVFLLKIFNSIPELTPSQRSNLESYIDDLLSYFKKENKEVKDWLTFLIIARFIYDNILTHFIAYSSKRIRTKHLPIVYSIWDTASKKNWKRANISDLLKRHVLGRYLEDPAIEKYINRIYAFANIERQRSRKVYLDKIIETVFVTLYENLYKKSLPFSGEDKEEFVDRLLILLMEEAYALGNPLNVALKYIEIQDKDKFVELLDFLFYLSRYRSSRAPELKSAWLKIIINAFVYHKKRLGSDILIKKLEEYRRRGIAESRLLAYMHLYEITKNRKYLNEAASESNLKIQKWAKRLLRSR